MPWYKTPGGDPEDRCYFHNCELRQFNNIKCNKGAGCQKKHERIPDPLWKKLSAPRKADRSDRSRSPGKGKGGKGGKGKSDKKKFGCRNWMKDGKCAIGENCFYAHITKEENDKRAAAYKAKKEKENH